MCYPSIQVWPRDNGTNREQQEVQVCENCWVRVKRADRRRLDELRVEVGVKKFYMVGHVERMGMKNWERDQIPRKCREKGD